MTRGAARGHRAWPPLARREEEMFFDILKAQIVDWRMAESLLARAERLEDAVRAGGVSGFENAIAADVRYSRSFARRCGCTTCSASSPGCRANWRSGSPP